MGKNSFGLHVAKWQTRKWSYNDHVLINIKWTRCIHSSYIHETAFEKSMDYGPGNGISHVLRLDSGFLNTCLNICSWIPRSLFENKESKQKWGFPDKTAESRRFSQMVFQIDTALNKYQRKKSSEYHSKSQWWSCYRSWVNSWVLKS